MVYCIHMRYYEKIYQYLDTVGDGSGSDNANGDYSLAEEIFFIQPPSNDKYEIARLIITIEDSAGMQAEEYGNLGAELTTGVQLRIQDDSGTISDITNGIKIKDNAHWGSLCFDVDVKTWGAGKEVFLARLTFKASGQPIILNGENNERLEVVLNDNLTGLIGHHFQVQGLNLSETRYDLDESDEPFTN